MSINAYALQLEETHCII